MENKRIVCFGGGNAMPKAVLEGLKKYPVKISVISAMLDSGGSAGRERELFKTKVSFGDIRRAALALSEAPPAKKELFSHRLENGIVLANAYCTNIALSLGIKELSEELKEDLNIPDNREVLPITLDDATLCAELENGEIVCGEGNIDVPKHNGNLKIKRVFLKPEAKAHPQALQVLKKADLITIGPGDLYSSLAQVLLVKGIPQAISKSKAKKVYICNLMTKHGETNGFTVLDFTQEIEKYLGELLDFVIYNIQKSSPERVAIYRENHPELLELVNLDEKIIPGKKYIGADLLAPSGSIVHDPDKLAKVILNLCPRQ